MFPLTFGTDFRFDRDCLNYFSSKFSNLNLFDERGLSCFKYLIDRRATRGGGGGEVYPSYFQKLKKSALIYEKKRPDCGHLWVKFLI